MLEHALNQIDNYLESEASTTGKATHPKKKSGSSKCMIQ